MGWTDHLILAIFFSDIAILIYNLISYRKFARVKYMGKCMLLICTGMFTSIGTYLTLFLGEGSLLTFIVNINTILGMLINVLMIQIILGLLGRSSGRTVNRLNLLLLIPAAAVVLTLTNGFHGMYMESVTKHTDGRSFVVDMGPVGLALSAVSSVLITVILIYAFIEERKAKNRIVGMLLLLSIFFPTLIGFVETILQSSYGFNYRINIFFYWVPISAMLSLYFGYLKTARSKAIEVASEIYVVFDKWGNKVDSNEMAESFFRLHTGKSIEGKAELLGIIATGSENIVSEKQYDFETITMHGEPRYYSLNTFQISDSLSQHCGDGFIIREITAYREEMNSLNEMAVKDPLTGVFNRRYFDEYSSEAVKRSLVNERPLTMLMLDIDLFKNVNDTYGHSVGDDVLKGLCTVCKRNLRKNDMLFRYGGEEFIIVCEDTGYEQGALLAERIRAAIEREGMPTGAGSLRVTASVGGCSFTAESGDDALRWVENADKCMYDAKQAGRNRVAFFRQTDLQKQA